MNIGIKYSPRDLLFWRQ